MVQVDIVVEPQLLKMSGMSAPECFQKQNNPCPCAELTAMEELRLWWRNILNSAHSSSS